MCTIKNVLEPILVCQTFLWGFLVRTNRSFMDESTNFVLVELLAMQFLLVAHKQIETFTFFQEKFDDRSKKETFSLLNYFYSMWLVLSFTLIPSILMTLTVQTWCSIPVTLSHWVTEQTHCSSTTLNQVPLGIVIFLDFVVQ